MFGKRGIITDTALFTVMLFVVAISLLLIYVAYDSISVALDDLDLIPDEHADRFSEGADAFPNTWDYVFLTVFIGVVLGILIISFVLATQPVFFFVFMLVVVVLGALAGYIANAFDEIILNPLIGASAGSFPILSFIMSNYLLFIVVTIMLMLVVFYAKPNQGGGY